MWTPRCVRCTVTVCAVHGHAKQGAAYGYTGQLGYHPLLATRADTGEVVHTRMRKGSANTARGAQRFVRETVGRVRRAGATGPLTLRADSGFCGPRSARSDAAARPLPHLRVRSRSRWCRTAAGRPPS